VIGARPLRRAAVDLFFLLFAGKKTGHQ